MGWKDVKPVDSREPVYPHPIMFAMENKQNLIKEPKVSSTFLSEKETKEPIIIYANDQSTYQDDRPISGSGNYNFPDTSSTFEYTRSLPLKEQTLTTEKISFQAA